MNLGDRSSKQKRCMMRSTRAFVFAAVCTLVVIASTDALAELHVSGGIKGGINIANLHGADAKDTESITGFAAGAFFILKITDFFAIQPEILLTRKGAEGDTSIYHGEVELNYIEIPVLLKLSIPAHARIRPSLLIGPALAANLSARAKGGSNSIRGETEIDDWVKDTDFSLVFGADVDFDLGSARLLIDGRYTLGVTSIDDTDLEKDFKTGALSIAAGIAFPF